MRESTSRFWVEPLIFKTTLTAFSNPMVGADDGVGRSVERGKGLLFRQQLEGEGADDRSHAVTQEFAASRADECRVRPAVSLRPH